MKIFASEKEIAEQIKKDKTIAYTSQIEKIDNKDVPNNFIPFSSINKDIEEIVKASIQDKELFYHTAILVSTTINKNDDVFLPEVVWAARNTPVHKPTNLEHDNNKIIGHMTGSWAINEDGSLIEEEDITKLPGKFHILVGSVIYKYWPNNKEYTEQVNALLDSIEQGNKFVSMECRFKAFDYSLASEKEFKIIERNEDTAFLSKYLRAYGGTGEFKEYKIGRVVRDISFCGKGYVNKPANPESIIFTKDDIQDFSKASYEKKISILNNNGVLNNSDISQENTSLNLEKVIMSEFYQEQNKELKSTNDKLVANIEELKDKLTQSNVTKLEKEIESLKTQATDINDALKAKTDILVAKEDEVKEIQKKLDESVKANETLTKSNSEFSEKLAKIELESKTQARISTLVDGGISKEDATVKVAKFTNLNDEQFAEISAELIEAATYKKKMEKPSDKPTDKKKDMAKADVVDDAKIDDAEIASASVEDEKYDISELAEHLSAALKTRDKDGDK